MNAKPLAGPSCADRTTKCYLWAMSAKKQRSPKEMLERYCVEAVGGARGCAVEDDCDRDPNGFPDGWIRDRQSRIGVEVVQAFPAKDASAWMQAYETVRREAAQAEHKDGIRRSWTVSAEGLGIVVAANEDIPVRLAPRDPITPIGGVFPAIGKKSQRYGGGETSGTILVVCYTHWPFPLDKNQLRSIGEHASRVNARFLELWVVNAYCNPAQQVPFDGGPANKALNATGAGAPAR